MSVKCPNCQSKAITTSSHELSAAVKDMYCVCTNVENCGATFVTTQALKHYLNPPRITTLQIAAGLINNLSVADRKELLQQDLFG